MTTKVAYTHNFTGFILALFIFSFFAQKQRVYSTRILTFSKAAFEFSSDFLQGHATHIYVGYTIQREEKGEVISFKAPIFLKFN